MKKENNKSKKFNMSMSAKVITIIVFFIVFSAITWISVMFLNMERNAKENAIADEITYIRNLENNADSLEEMCNLTKQIVSENYTILDLIISK